MSQKIEDEQNNWSNFSPGITWELGKLQNVIGKVYLENNCHAQVLVLFSKVSESLV